MEEKVSTTRFRGRGVTAVVALGAMVAATAALAAGSLPGNQSGRMTGGGEVISKRGVKITHGFELRCPDVKGPNRLQVNWDGGNRFHLGSLSSIVCTDSADWEEGNPEAGFDTYRGIGTGKLNGVEGASIKFKFGDAGEPGVDDWFEIAIFDNSGTRVVSADTTLLHGNHQAHR